MGVGGNVSQGILKALALSPLPHRVIGVCISATSIGLYRSDSAYISPLAKALLSRSKGDVVRIGGGDAEITQIG